MRKILKRIATFVATSALVTAMCISALAADTYNVAGAEGLTGVNWDPSQNQMTDNGEYNLEGDASSGGANAKVDVEEDGSTVTITFDGTKAAVSVTPATQTPTAPSAPQIGDATPVVATVVAMIGLACVVVSMKAKQENK